VEDTGPGIPEHLYSKIFEPFVQGDLGLNKKYGGTGLGLSICSQLASLMRGTIRMESKVGHSSIFVMTILLKYVGGRTEGTASLSVDLAIMTLLSRSRPADKAWVPRLTDNTRLMRPAYASLGVVAVADRPPSTASSIVALEPYLELHLVSVSHSPSASASSLEQRKSQAALWVGVETDVMKHKGTTRVLVAEDNKTN
jgi:osomolarity two-component system sensor histidine kinase SLN1